MHSTETAKQPPIAVLANLLHTGRHDLLIKEATVCLSRWPKSAPLLQLLALAHLSSGQLRQAVGPLSKLTKIFPQDASVHEQLASTLHQSGQIREALLSYENCLALEPNRLSSILNAASIDNELGNYAKALKRCQRAQKIAPAQPECIFNQARAEAGLGKTEEAIHSYLSAAKVTSDSTIAQNDIGLKLFELGATSEAEICLRRALQIDPSNALAHSNLGLVLETQGKPEDALASFRSATQLNPKLARTFANIGALLNTQRHFDAAAEACHHALSIEPKLVSAQINLANALLGLQRHAEAELIYQQVLSVAKSNSDALNNLGNLLLDQRRFSEAESCFRQIKSDNGYAREKAFHAAAHLCDWQRRSTDTIALKGYLSHDNCDIDPFGLLTLNDPDAPSIHRRAAMLAAKNLLGTLLAGPPIVNPSFHPIRERLRIGYLSADFHDHATMHLLGGVLQAHDNRRFDIHLYSYGPNSNDAYRKLAVDNCALFRDITTYTDHDAAKQIAEDGVDILVDLKGFTRSSRLAISALRPAPVIASWLGYPGTLGHERLADYIIGDPVVTPPEAAADYSETLALLPNCYQPNDRNRNIGVTPERHTEGLPNDAFVFCSFNQSYKIIPEVFDIWCKLLANVPNAILWLLASPLATENNLRQAAAQRGISPDRLVFAPKLPLTEHLGRIQLADLALDTFPYGSHTTGSDALWAGVPLITNPGKTFASRVAASLLTSIGCPELITASWDEYFGLAIQLATDRQKLDGIRQKICAQRMQTPLFDTLRFTADLERLFDEIWKQHRSGRREMITLASCE